MVLCNGCRSLPFLFSCCSVACYEARLQCDGGEWKQPQRGADLWLSLCVSLLLPSVSWWPQPCGSHLTGEGGGRYQPAPTVKWLSRERSPVWNWTGTVFIDLWYSPLKIQYKVKGIYRQKFNIKMQQISQTHIYQFPIYDKSRSAPSRNIKERLFFFNN